MYCRRPAEDVIPRKPLAEEGAFGIFPEHGAWSMIAKLIASAIFRWQMACEMKCGHNHKL